jgi:hypothetical protein
MLWSQQPPTWWSAGSRRLKLPSRFTVVRVACMIARVMVSRNIDEARAAAERLAKEPG